METHESTTTHSMERSQFMDGALCCFHSHGLIQTAIQGRAVITNLVKYALSLCGVTSIRVVPRVLRSPDHSPHFVQFTGLLDLRSVMRFFWSFPPAIGYALFSLAVGSIHLSCQPPTPACTWSPAHLEPQKSLAQHTAGTQIGTHVLHRSATCHVRCRTRSSRLTQNRQKANELLPATLHCQDSLVPKEFGTIFFGIEEPIQACNLLAFNSSPETLRDTGETVLPCTSSVPSDCRKSGSFPTRPSQRRLTCSAMPSNQPCTNWSG